MKRAGCIVLVLMLMTGILTSDAWAGGQVYITVSIGGGVFIGVVGVFFHVVFQQRIAQQHQQDQVRVADNRLLPLDLKSSGQTGQESISSPLFLEQFKQNNETKRADRPDIAVNFFTFRW
jgi:hypothetical protein